MGSSMDNRHMLLQATFLILFLTSVSAQCVYSETKCRCRKETSGNLCLRHTGDYICKAYECGEGYACDCSGLEMCDIGPCKDDQVSFRPVNTILESVGQIVRCMPFRKEKCVMPHSKLSCLTVKKPMINKFMPNPMPQRGSNPDPMSMEIRGEPGDSFYGHVTSIESDSLPASGSINDVRTVIGHFDENGILVVDTNGLEKPSFTLVLSSDQPGLPGEQLDQNGNDIIDNQGAFGTIYDAIGVPDNVQNEKHLYGVNLGGTNFKFVGGEPYVVFRDSCSGELYAVDPSRKVILDSRANVLNFEDFNVPMTNVLAPKFGEANPTRRSSMMDTES